MNKPEITLNVTANDKLTCECGNDVFYSASKLASVKPPIIGSDPILVSLEQLFLCSKCDKKVEK